MSDEIDRAALVRDHLQAFNARDLERSIGGLSETVVWRTGTDVVVGRAAVEAFLGDAISGLLPTLRIRSLVAGEDLVACELEERYRHEGVDHRAAIAAFFRFTGERISEVKVAAPTPDRTGWALAGTRRAPARVPADRRRRP